MELFKKQIQFIENLERDFYNSLRDSIERNNLVIVDYIVNKQLYDKGVDGDNKKLRGYKRTTIKYKIRKNQVSDRTTLKDEGLFHASINIDAYDDRFEVSSDVNYAKYLIKRYGKNILKPSTDKMNIFFKKYFIPELKKKTNDKFTR